jgi:exodeoxyribonuclease-3
MKIATWNVNSIRARLDRLLPWIDANRPDVMCLQETKVENESFPAAELLERGYHAAIHGQRTYNGVAILAREPPTDLLRGFGDGGDDTQARFLVARAAGVRVASVYVPNGQAVGTAKFVYKLDWLGRWRRWLDAHASPDEALALCGDFNVAPADLDVHDPAAWKDQLHCHPDERAALAAVRGFGVSDLFRQRNPALRAFSWWDYHQLAFARDNGLRIDHIFATAPLAARCLSARIDRDARKGQQPSDHAPVIAEFAD